MKKVYIVIEPGEDWEPVHTVYSREAVINNMKNIRKYDTDQEAIDDFVVVNWAIVADFVEK